MFKHNKEPEEAVEKKPDLPVEKKEDTSVDEKAKGGHSDKLTELLEKNLKWSQIIYEQNRKINRKMLWAAIGSWLKVLLIAVPLVLGLLYLPPLIKQLTSSYTDLLGGVKSGQPLSPSSVDSMLELLPLSPAQKAQLKTMLK